MRTLKVVAVVIITLGFVSAAALFLIGFFRPKPGGLRVETSPASSVYINGEFAGKTPFRKTIPASTLTLRLVPGGAAQTLFPYETKLSLIPGTETVVQREFGTSEDLSSGDVLTFEKTGEKSAGILVISNPENAQVSLDGVIRGFAPYKSSTVSPGEHQINIKSPGFQDGEVLVNTLVGYQLTVFAKLATGGQGNASASPSPSPTPMAKTYVQILKTPTGFLRVRTEPGTAGEEIAEVKPGSKYPFLGSDAATGWYKIQYEEPQPGLPNGIAGWVSGQYSQIATESATPQ